MRPWAIAAFAITLLGWAGYLPLAKVPALRATLWPLWPVLALGATLGFWVLAKLPPPAFLERGLAYGALGLAVLFVPVYFLILRVPAAAGRPEPGQPLPALRFTAETGAPLETAERKGKGPLLLVFYRGFW